MLLERTWDAKSCEKKKSGRQSSIQFSSSCLVVSEFLQTQGLQHTRLPCPSPTPRAWDVKLMSIELVMPSNHLILCHPLLFLPSVFKLISFRIDWFGLLAVQGTLKSLLQHHSSKASLGLNFLYRPTLTSIHDYWKNHSFH